MFSTSFDHSGWEPTCYGILGQQELEKSWKMPHSKKVKFQDLLKLEYFLIFNIFGFLSITSLKKHSNRKCLGCFEKFRKFAARYLHVWPAKISDLLTKKIFQRKREWNINKQTWTSISYVFLLLPLTCHTSLHTNFFMNPKR